MVKIQINPCAVVLMVLLNLLNAQPALSDGFEIGGGSVTMGPVSVGGGGVSAGPFSIGPGGISTTQGGGDRPNQGFQVPNGYFDWNREAWVEVPQPLNNISASVPPFGGNHWPVYPNGIPTFPQRPHVPEQIRLPNQTWPIYPNGVPTFPQRLNLPGQISIPNAGFPDVRSAIGNPKVTKNVIPSSIVPNALPEVRVGKVALPKNPLPVPRTEDYTVPRGFGINDLGITPVKMGVDSRISKEEAIRIAQTLGVTLLKGMLGGGTGGGNSGGGLKYNEATRKTGNVSTETETPTDSDPDVDSDSFVDAKRDDEKKIQDADRDVKRADSDAAIIDAVVEALQSSGANESGRKALENIIKELLTKSDMNSTEAYKDEEEKRAHAQRIIDRIIEQERAKQTGQDVK